MKPFNVVKPSRALPTVPNANVNKMENVNVKLTRALPRVPKQEKKTITVTGRHGRALPEVPFRETGHLKNSDTSLSSRTSTPQRAHNISRSSHYGSLHELNNNSNNNNNNNNNNSTTKTHHHSNKHHHHHHHTHTHAHNGQDNQSNATSTSHGHQGNGNVTSTHGNTTHRALPKLPKLLQKPKPEQNRIEYMHDLYRKEGDKFSEEGNYEQALKSYNLVGAVWFCYFYFIFYF